jgi:hypothetical protein
VISNPWNVTVTTANCGSAVDAIEFDGPASSATCMIVRGHVTGCGTSWFGTNCNGRGWLGYNITMHYLQYARQLLAQQDFMKSVTGGPINLMFKYDPSSIPGNARDTEWHYKVTVMIKQGPNDPHPTPVYLSDDVPNDVPRQIYTTFDESLGELTISLPGTYRGLQASTAGGIGR